MLHSLDEPWYDKQDEEWIVFGGLDDRMARWSFKSRIEAWKFYIDNKPTHCPLCHKPL